MDRDNERSNNNPHVSSDFLVRRKRGRPRKNPRPDPNNPGFVGPPGYARANRYQTGRSDLINGSNDVMVGKQVNGVIEAVFDAGYLLSVRVGNSETMLRGVVFKPGHYVPVSADNDVAPNVPMIRRDNVHVLSKSQRGRARDYGVSQKVKDRRLVPISPQPTMPRGCLVPVVLQPANLQNGGGIPNQVLEPSHSENGSLPTDHVENQMIHSQPHSGPHMVPGVTQGETGHGQSFETLLSEVMKRGQVQAPSLSVEAESDDQALCIEPLQAIHPVQSVSISKPMPTYGTGKMTELLQAVQENMRETQASQANDLGAE